jgi:Subtilase family/PA domain/FG-GAP-like repeat
MASIRKWGVALVMCGAAIAAAASYRYASDGFRDASASKVSASSATGALALPAGPAASDGGGRAKTVDGDPRRGKGTFIVMMKEAPLATYKGTVHGMPAPDRIRSPHGKQRIDVAGGAAKRYVGYLQRRQADLKTRMSARMGRDVKPRQAMQHAVNAIVVDLTSAEAAAVRGMPGVQFVEEYREYAIAGDIGPQLIGAEPVWNGTNPGAGGQYRGEGMVIAILDTGINFGSPSFAATSPIGGYAHVNPLGSGNYLGTCANFGVDTGRCNAKLIGGYDFVCGEPANLCGAADVREEPGFGDTNSHGSHTASIAAGNPRDVVYAGVSRRISGVAPRANIVAYDVCYTNTTTGGGRCPQISSVAAVDQIVAGGIVDVINFSIAGGDEPWSEAVSLAFLGAVEAGVYVSAAVGNAGPEPGVLAHVEPWVASVGAVQHGRGVYSLALQVTGPAPVPPSLAPVLITEGSAGTPHNTTIPGTTPLKISARIDAVDDGCAAYAAGTFTGAIAVIRRGTCNFTVKAANAAAAGAIAVVIANNSAGTISPPVPGATIRVFAVTQSDGDALRDFAVSRPNATAQIGYPVIPVPNTPDVLGWFSSRGPAGRLSVLKPDSVAPGVLVLAAISGQTLTGFEQEVGLKSGSSMSSPMHAGAAALVRQARPAWTVPEVKSALALTANQQVFNEDSVTPATPFGRGSGRIQVDRAINAGLVMDESAANYRAANPAIGGDPATLNQPSLASTRCFPSCTFVRRFRNTQAVASTWNLALEGLPGSVPASVTIPAGGTAQVSITISPVAASNAWQFGNVVLSQPGSSSATLRMPVAVITTLNKARNDFNGDGKSDIVLWNPSISYLAYWIMNGPAYTGSGGFGVAAGAAPAATGFLTAIPQTSLLARNTATQTLYSYIWNGNTHAQGTVGGTPPDWALIGTGDIDGDGNGDLFWRNTGTGQFAYWLMNGAVYLGGQTYGTPVTYDIASIADFNGDGRVDLLWNDPGTRNASVWTSTGDGFSVAQIGQYGTDWNMVGTADVTGDGKADIVLRNNDKTYLAYWRMDGAVYQGSSAFGLVSDRELFTTGDFDGDGNEDLVINRASDRSLYLWRSNGSVFTETVIGQHGAEWTVVK